MKVIVLKGFWILLLTLSLAAILPFVPVDNFIVEGAPVSVENGNFIFNATEDHLFQEVLEPIDIDGEDLSWSILWAPGWISFLNGTIYGTPGNDDVGWNNFTVEASTNIDQATLNVSILVLNTDPQIMEGSVAPMGWEDQFYSSQFDLREEGDQWEVSLEMTGPWNTTWAQIGRNGTVYGTPKNIHVGNWTLNITLDDGNGGVAWYEWLVTIVNEPPEITVKEYGIVQEWVEETIDFDCGSEGDGATYYQMYRDDFVGELDPVTGKFTFIPGFTGTHYGYITIEALDFFGGSDRVTLEIIINNTPPELLTELPDTFIAGEITEVDIDSNEEGLFLYYDFHHWYPIFSDLYGEARSFYGEGKIRFFPWNMDVGEYSYQIYLRDHQDSYVYYYWNFTVVENRSFSDPTINVSVLDISPKRIQLEIDVNESSFEYYYLSDPRFDNYVAMEYPGIPIHRAFTSFDPLTERFVEMDYSNISGPMNVTVWLYFENMDGSYRSIRKTIQVNIPEEKPVAVETGGDFPWWQVIMIVVILLILLVIITLIFVENVSYAIQMAIFRGGTIDEEPILTLVHDKPGIQFRELLKYSNFSRRDLVSTLVVLEKEGNIRPLPDGVLVRFYPTVGSFVDGPLALNRHQESIARALFDRKKITHQELSDETGISKKRLRREASLMGLKGALSEKTGKEGAEYYLSSKQKKRIKDWMENHR